MRTTDLIRCKLSMWLDAQSDRIHSLAEWVSPVETGIWEKYDEWAQKRGHYDWWLKK